METISIWYEPLGSILGVKYYHETLVYTNSAGETYLATAFFTASSVPANNERTMEAAESAVSNGDASQSPWQAIGTVSGSPTDAGVLALVSPANLLAATNPSDIVATGDNLALQWASIVSAYASIASELLPYNPLDQNSNSVASTALIAAGITPPDASLISGHWAPASMNILPISSGDLSDAGSSSFQNADITVPGGVEESIVGGQNTVQFALGAPSLGIVYGSSNFIFGNVGDLVDVMGDNNSVSLSTGAVSVQGIGNSVIGAADAINVQGSGNSISGNSDTINVAASSSVNVAGNNSVINGADSDIVAIIGTNSVVTAGNDLTLTAESANVTAGDRANVSASGTISVGDDSSVTGGGEITAGNNATVTLNSGDVTAGSNATVVAGLSGNSSQPTMITTGDNAKITVSSGYADVSMGDGSVLTMVNGEFSLHFLNDNVHVVYAGQMIFSADIYLNQNVLDYTFSSAHLIDPATGLGFLRYTLSRPGSPDEVIDEGDQYNTILTPLNFHFLDFDGDPAAFQQLVTNVASGQNIGMVQSFPTLTVQASAASTLQGQATFIDKRPGESHTVAKTFDVASSTGPEVGALTVTMAADSSATAGAINLSYAENTSLLHTLSKTAAPQLYVQNYDVSILDHEGSPFSQTVTADVYGYALTTVTGPTTATINENSTSTSASGTLTLHDSDPLDVHHAHVTYVSTSGAGESSQLGTLGVSLTSDTSAANPNGTATWSYAVNPTLLASVPAGQTITETFQVSFDDGAGNTTAPQNIVVTLNTVPDAGPATVQFDAGHAGSSVSATMVGQVSGAGAHTVTGKIFFSDPALRDVDTVSATNAFGFANAVSLTLSAPVKGSDGEYEIDWSYTATDAQIIAHLGTLSSRTDAYTLTVSDGPGHFTPNLRTSLSCCPRTIRHLLSPDLMPPPPLGRPLTQLDLRRPTRCRARSRSLMRTWRMRRRHRSGRRC